ncbi:MAG: hypothetical protein RIB79_11420 [Allomuricauda sp.]
MEKDNHTLVATIEFEINGELFECEAHQNYGTGFSFFEEPITVVPPDSIKAKINFAEFRDAVEEYYRLLVGSTGIISIAKRGVINMTMVGNKFNVPWECEIKNEGIEGPW